MFTLLEICNPACSAMLMIEERDEAYTMRSLILDVGGQV